MKTKTSGGYIGLLMLLITVALIGVWFYYYSPLQSSHTTDIQSGSNQSELETIQETRTGGIQAIDAAQHAKDLLESKIHIETGE